MIRWALLPVLLTVSCGSFQREHKSPAIGVAYAGPARLNLRKEIDLKSGAVAIAHHGDKLEIVGQRRRWYKVRTARGIEGWTSDRELLDPAQMQRLKALAAESAGLPSQGVATTFSPINVHTEPSRQAASFVQVQPKEKVDVIMRKVAGRVPLPKRELLPPKTKPVLAKKKDKASRVSPPPAPMAPTPPADWMQLSQERAPEPDSNADEDVPEGPKDDWTLIRTPAGQSGWVLTSSLYLAIPDEVAQYAEGHRITSYFSLGKIEDGAEKKDIWLWTTAEKLGEPWDFDSYRVFVWSLRHHRYETAYIQRREQGYFPVLAKTGEFSVCLAQNDGTRLRKKYTMLGNAVRPSGTEPCTPESIGDDPPQQLANAESVPASTGAESFLGRLESRVKRLVKR